MKISYSKVFVNDQDKALKFYTEVLGFEKAKDVSNGGYRWLTVAAPGAGSPELVLELNSNPAYKAFQQAIHEQSIPANNFDVADVHKEAERLKQHGVKFPTEPYQVMPGVEVAILDDTVGNLIQIQKVGK